MKQKIPEKSAIFGRCHYLPGNLGFIIIFYLYRLQAYDMYLRYTILVATDCFRLKLTCVNDILIISANRGNGKRHLLKISRIKTVIYALAE